MNAPRRSVSARRHLALFAAALALPMLVMVGLTLWQYARAERTRLEGDAVQRAQSIATALDRELRGVVTALDLLSLSVFLQTGDLAGFHRQATEVGRRQGVTPVLRDLTGQQLVNTRRPFGEPLPRVVLPTDEEALATRSLRFSNLFTGAVSGEPIFAVTLPVLRDGWPVYTLSLAIEAARLRDVIRAESPPEGWTVAVVDGAGAIMARNLRHEEFVGRQASRDLLENTRGQGGTWQGTTVAGEPVFGAYSRTAIADWRLAVGIGAAQLNAPLTRSLWLLAGMGAGLLTLSGLLAVLFGRRITAPLNALAAQAAQVGRGVTVAPPQSSFREANEVGRALAEASALLARREEENRRAEASLAAGERKFRTIADAMPQMVWSTRPDGFHDYYNDRWYEFTGVPYGSTDGEGWNGMFHPDDQEEAWRRWRHSLETGDAYEVEYRLRHRSGEYRWTLGRALPIRDGEGRIERWFGTCTDIHDFKRAEDRLRESEAQFRTLADSIPQLAWMTEADGSITWYNRRWYAFTGTTPDEMLGWGWRSVHHPDHVEPVTERFRRAIAAGEPWEDTFPLRGADGAYRWFLSRALPIRDEAGRIVRWFGTNTDVTEAREAQAELKEANEEIQRFAYIVSHDLRAPLVNIMGFTSELETLRDEMLEAGAKPPGDPGRERTLRDFDESVTFIKAAIDKMEGLIGAILKLSREGRRTFRPEPLDLAALVRGLVDAQRHQVESAGAAVVVGAMPALTADRLAVEQILGNLLDNAVKYLDPARPGRIEVAGEALGPRVRIRVRDNGRGIEPKDHARVFELFRRSGAQDRPGEGIGLAHVRTLVRSLGGRIDLASEPGAGTTFTVTLPRTAQAGADLAAAAE